MYKLFSLVMSLSILLNSLLSFPTNRVNYSIDDCEIVLTDEGGVFEQISAKQGFIFYYYSDLQERKCISYSICEGKCEYVKYVIGDDSFLRKEYYLGKNKTINQFIKKVKTMGEQGLSKYSFSSVINSSNNDTKALNLLVSTYSSGSDEQKICDALFSIGEPRPYYQNNNRAVVVSGQPVLITDSLSYSVREVDLFWVAVGTTISVAAAIVGWPPSGLLEVADFIVTAAGVLKLAVGTCFEEYYVSRIETRSGLINRESWHEETRWKTWKAIVAQTAAIGDLEYYAQSSPAYDNDRLIAEYAYNTYLAHQK